MPGSRAGWPASAASSILARISSTGLALVGGIGLERREAAAEGMEQDVDGDRGGDGRSVPRRNGIVLVWKDPLNINDVN